MAKDPERLDVFASGSGDGVGELYLSSGICILTSRGSSLTNDVSSQNMGLDK